MGATRLKTPKYCAETGSVKRPAKQLIRREDKSEFNILLIGVIGISLIMVAIFSL